MVARPPFIADPAKSPYRPGAFFLGLGDDGREFGITTERHAITIAGSRSGKGAAVLIPNALRWPHNLLTVDPKGEVAAETWEAREAMGQTVHVLDPFAAASVPDRLRAAFNPLAAIDANSPTAREDIQVLADGLVKRSNPDHEEWYDGAISILAGIIAFVVAEAPPAERTFAAVRSSLLKPDDELYQFAQVMLETKAFGGLAREAGITIMTGIKSEKGMEKQFLGGARRASSWMDSPQIAAVMSRSSFDLNALKSGNVSLFLVLPPKYLDVHGAFLRLFVRASLNAMMRDGATINRRCLFLLDEFASLGRLDAISKGMGLMAGYGLHLWPFLQDHGQLIALYGPHVSGTFFANSDVAMFFGNTDYETLEYVSSKLGNLTPDEISYGAPMANAAQFGPQGWGAAEAARDYTNANNSYQHRMKKVGTRRVPPEQVAAFVGKGDGDKVARSAIIFGKSGDVFLVNLKPFFNSYKENTYSKIIFISSISVIIIASIISILYSKEWVSYIFLGLVFFTSSGIDLLKLKFRKNWVRR